MKTKTNIDERILALAEPIAADMGLQIVRVRVMAGKRRTVQIMAERISDGMIHIDECAALSRELSSVMEVEDPIAEAYMLEVGSMSILISTAKLIVRPLFRLIGFQKPNFSSRMS